MDNQYINTCTKAGHGVKRLLFKQHIEIIYKLDNPIWTTLGNKSTLLDIANGKSVCRMSQISQPSLFTNKLILQLCLRPSSPFRVRKLLIYANADYHKISLKTLQTKHNKYHFKAKKQLFK